MRLLNNLDLDRNEIQNVVIHQVGALPASPKNGMVSYLTASGQQGMYLYKEGNWIHLGQVEALSNGAIQITPVSGVQYLSVRVDDDTIVINASGNLEVGENSIGLREIDTVEVRATDLNVPNKNLDLATFKIVNLGPPTLDKDATTKEYVDTEIAQKIAAMGEFMGDWSLSTLPTTGSGSTGEIIKGDWWRMSAAVTIAGEVAEIGDALFAKIDNPGTVNANWFLLQSNVGEATDTALGMVRVSTSADVTATNGTNLTRVVRVGDLLDRTANTLRRGLIKIATQAEVDGGSLLDRAVTPGTMSIYVNTLISATGFSMDVGDGIAGSITITHNLNSKDVIVSIRQNSLDEDEVWTDIKRPTVNSISVAFAVIPTTAQYRVSILKVG